MIKLMELFMHFNKYKLILPNLFLIFNFGLNAMELSKVKPANITQIDVASQNPQSGTCGYHALYNGIMIAKSLKNSSDLKFFNKSNFNKRLFKDLKQIWKEQVVEQRIKFLLKQLIVDYIFKNLIPDKEIVAQKPNSGSFYELNLSHEYIKLIPVEQIENCDYSEEERKAICDILIEIADNAIDKVTYLYNENIKHFCIKSERIFEVFERIILEKLQKSNFIYTNNRFYTKIRNNTFYISGYIKNDNIIMSELCNESDIDKKESWVLVNYKIDWSNISKKGQALESSKPGHWVSSKEIEYLINILLDKKRSSSSFLPENTKIFCLEGNIQDLFNLEDNLKQAAIEFKDKNYEGTTIFILYYPQHWVTCVVDKKKNEHPRFIFADSLNIDRTKSDQAFELIGELSDFNFVQDKFIPLNLLVEDKKITELENTIELLNSNLKDLRGLWLYGPAKTGKSSLANSLSKLTNWPLKNINTPKPDIIKSISKSDRIKDKNIKEIVQFYSKFIEELLNELKQENSPTILFIRHIDKIKDLYKKKIFKLFAKMVEDHKKNNRLFIMFSSNTNPEELAQYYDFSDLVDYMKIDSPNYNKRLKIIHYYIQNLLYKNILIKSNKDKRTYSLEENFIREAYREILATLTKDFSCQDIEDMIKKIEIAIKRDLKNYGKNSIFYRIFNFIDSKNKSVSTTTKMLTFGTVAGATGFSVYKLKPSKNNIISFSIAGLMIITGIGYHQSSDLLSANEYEKYLQTYYEIQKQQVATHKKIKIAKNKIQQLIKEKETTQKKSLIVELKDAYRQGIIDWTRTNATSHMDKLVSFTADFVINVTKAFYNIIKNNNNQNHRVAIPVIQTQNNAPNIAAAQEDRSQ